jgi:hypothetical protein
MNRRTLLLTGLAAAAPTHAQPATKIALGYTAVTDFASAFVAVEEGYFSKRGLDVQPQRHRLLLSPGEAAQTGVAAPQRVSHLLLSAQDPRRVGRVDAGGGDF